MPRCFSRQVCIVFFLCLVFIVPTSAAPDKPIRLRNSLSDTQVAMQIQTPLVASSPASGLFVIQFRESIKLGWREQLHSLGVDLLRYVPDDAFVARFSNASVGEIRALEFVQFVGAYAAPQKVHHQLQIKSPVATGTFEVSVLLSPETVQNAWSYYKDVQTKDQKYTPLIAPDDQPAIDMNKEKMEKFRPEMRKYYYDPAKYKTYLEQLGIQYPTVRK